MHYKNGREAKNGDKVVLFPTYGAPLIGILYDATAGNDYCNGKIAPVSPTDPCPNLKECLHLDDVLAAVAPKDPEEVAGRMYDAYCEAVGGVAFNGDPLPKWSEFRADPNKTKQSDAWVTAAKAY